MNLIENMTLSELDAEKKALLCRIDAAKAALEKIHGKKDYSDEMVKYFHLGKVGFLKDAKRHNQILDGAINNGVKACEYYQIIDEAKGRIHAINRAVNFIAENNAHGETVRLIKENQNKPAALKWEKVFGHYGIAYKCGNVIIESVESGFVAVRDSKGNLLTHCKTVKEAKATVSRAVAKKEINSEADI